MSLLIVRCPLKPFAGLNSSLSGDATSEWQDLACEERFEWCLIDDSLGARVFESGMGTPESMPYADEVLVLLPTLDVRLIEAKLPLANAKKLQQILPNLIEEFVLFGAQSLVAQVLPPIPGQPALQRTIALTDRNWFAWLTKQLEGLISHRVRLVPDCLILPLPSKILADKVDDQHIVFTIAYHRDGENMIFIQRTGQQIGVAWVEKIPADSTTPLPQVLKDAELLEFSWDWVAQSAQQFLAENQSNKSANYALNLLPKTFKRSGGKKGIASLSGLFKPNHPNNEVRSGATWSDQVIWQPSILWAKYLVTTIVFGYLLHLSWLVIDNWRWGKQMEVLAAQSLTPASIAKLNQEQSVGVLDAFVKQVTEDQRRQGLVTDADFVPMAAKLQQLKSLFGPEIIQRLDYNGYSIEFEFKPGSVKQTNSQILQKARSLGLMVKPLGKNRYRLEPYSGLKTAL